MPDFIDPIEWYRRDYLDARIRGDEQRQELAHLFDLFAQNQRLDRDKAIAYLNEGQALAQKIKQPYWELLFDYWLYSMKSGGIGDLDAIVRLFMKVSRPPYNDCPIIGRIYTALVEAYIWEDPISYATEIRDAIRFTTEQMPLSEESYQRIMVAQLRLHYELQEYELMLALAKTALHFSEKYPQDLFYSYIYLAHAHAALAEYDAASDYAILAQRLAQWQKSLDLERAAFNVHAMIKMRAGEDSAAEVLRFEMRQLDYQGAKWLDVSFDAEMDYWRASGGIFSSLLLLRFAKDVRDYYKKQGQPYWECRSYLHLIRASMDIPFIIRWLVLLMVGLPSMKELVLQAMESAQHLKKSDWFLDKLSAIAAQYMP